MPDVRQQTRSMLMSLTEQVEPFHEWLAGQRAYFLSQGYTDAEARAMAAAEFVIIFGANITRDSSE
jgi:hypothetical protein